MPSWSGHPEALPILCKFHAVCIKLIFFKIYLTNSYYSPISMLPEQLPNPPRGGGGKPRVSQTRDSRVAWKGQPGFFALRNIIPTQAPWGRRLQGNLSCRRRLQRLAKAIQKEFIAMKRMMLLVLVVFLGALIGGPAQATTITFEGLTLYTTPAFHFLSGSGDLYGN